MKQNTSDIVDFIQEKLFELADYDYADFQSKLTPTIPREQFIGVRVPLSRKLGKALMKEYQVEEFLHCLPHEYYDENILHGVLLSEIKDFQLCLEEVERFLPYVDNWAVCDIISPKVFLKKKDFFLEKIKEWSHSEHTYTSRFGLRMLMNHFLGDQDFHPEFLEIPAKIDTEEYYLKMMVAWFFAEALVKQWDSSMPYLEKRRLEPWTHRKAIQKACESTRITNEQKNYLKSLRE